MKKGDLSTSLESQFLDTLSEFNLVKKGEKIILALSGGPDSVFLTVLFNKFKNELEITPVPVYINHNLRGEEGAKDELFCSAIASSMGLEFHTRNIHPEAYAAGKKISVETASRYLRYNELQAVLQETGSDKIAVAHHLDDLVETMLFRLFKGTGVSGLLAIKPLRDNIIRPLIFIKKSDILSYLEIHKLDYRQDLTNMDILYDRNYIRNRIIPEINKRFPDFRDRMLSLYRIIMDEEIIWTAYLEDLKGSYTADGSSVIIDKLKLPKSSSCMDAVTRRLFRMLLSNFASLTSSSALALDTEFHPDFFLINKMLEYSKKRQGNKTLFDNGKLRVISSYDKLIIDKGMKKFPKSAKYVKLKGKLKVAYGVYRLVIEKLPPGYRPADKRSSADFCYFGTDGFDSVIIRSRKNGDSFHLPGTGRKKIKDLFIDCKFSVSQREGSFLLESENGKIIAVYIPGFGFRVSSDFYINEKTGSAVKIKVLNAVK